MSTFSGVSGRSGTRAPMAWATALAMAGATGVSAGSPMPLAPNGPSPLRDSRMMHSTLGTPMDVGIRYSLKDGDINWPSR